MTSCESVVLIQNVSFSLKHLQNKHNLCETKKKFAKCFNAGLAIERFDKAEAWRFLSEMKWLMCNNP